MNEKLKDLYEGPMQEWRNNREKNNLKTACPYLLKASDEYMNAKVRIMFCGQETNSWGGEEGYSDNPEKATIDALQGLYDKFVNKEQGSRSQFWTFQKAIRANYTENKNIAFISNNIVKVGKEKDSGCSDKIWSETKDYFNIIKNEIEILDPHLIIFLTGSNYDDKIQYNIGEFDENKRLFCKILSGKEIVCEEFCCECICCSRLQFKKREELHAIRIYHPRYLYSLGKTYKDNVINIINQTIKKISKSINS